MRVTLMLAAACTACSTAMTLPDSAPGNSCATALPLTVPAEGEQVAFRVAASGFADHFACYDSEGPDVVYRFDVDAPTVLSVEVDGGRAALGLNGSCDIGCPHSLNAPAYLTRASWSARLEPGPKVLIISGDGSTATLRRDAVVAGDQCASAIPVGFDGGVFTFETDFAHTFADGDCKTTNSEPSDLFFSLVVDAGVVLRQSTTGGAHVAVGPACGCVGATATRQLELEPGAHWVVLQSGRVLAPATLQLEAWPLAPGDRCADAIELAFATDGGVDEASASGASPLAGASTSGGCAVGEPDEFVHFVLTQPRDLSVRLTTTTVDATPTVELLRGCGPSGVTGVCASAPVAGSGAALSVTALPAGEYWLRVARAGSWRASVTLAN